MNVAVFPRGENVLTDGKVIVVAVDKLEGEHLPHHHKLPARRETLGPSTSLGMTVIFCGWMPYISATGEIMYAPLDLRLVMGYGPIYACNLHHKARMPTDFADQHGSVDP